MNDITAFALMYPNAYSRNPGDHFFWRMKNKKL